ncbi:MAG: ABC transporter permease, partial [Gemmobacter sp.]|uniref:ABC transporter permease n=1 Tax=Gemmobacter sp. TaxID=1898957 RepID=UPI001A56EFF5
MLTFTLRRLLLAIPTLLLISAVIFFMVDFAPGSPMADIPLTVPPEVRAKMMAAMGADQPVHIRYVLWLKQFFWNEPLYGIDALFGTDFAKGAQRIISWQSKVPVFQLIGERLPQTLTVVGTAYAIGILIALPIGIWSAYRQYSWFDLAGTFFSTMGFSVPTFFTGNLLILIFAVKLGWFPTIYDTNLSVTDWSSFYKMVMQMALPVTVLALFNAAEISRYTRASVLENLGQDYVRTARAKGMPERTVLL